MRAALALLVAVAALAATPADARPHHHKPASVLASFYHEGQLTATGERFRPDGLTCAHRSLRFGTKLRVSYRGRSVVVRVNDRGPAKWTGRVLDLSRGAARELGFLAAGVVRVTYQILGG